MNKVELGAPPVRRTSTGAGCGSGIRDHTHDAQGSISVSVYLVTGCVEGVVHGSDLVPPVPPDPAAQAVTSQALLDTLSVSAPELVVEAAELPVERWTDLASGRSRTMRTLGHVLPVVA